MRLRLRNSFEGMKIDCAASNCVVVNQVWLSNKGRAWTWRGSSRMGRLAGLRWAPGIDCAGHDQDTIVAGVCVLLARDSERKVKDRKSDWARVGSWA